MHEREAAGTELCYADLNGGHDLKICIYTSPPLKRVIGMGRWKDWERMFRVQRALSPETGVYNRIIMYISYSALISITIEQTTKSMKSFLLVQYQGDNQISMHASHNRIPILMTTSNQKRAIILVEKIFYDICEKKIFIKVRDSHEDFFYEDFFYSAISRW